MDETKEIEIEQSLEIQAKIRIANSPLDKFQSNKENLHET